MRKVVITGGLGFVGSHLSEHYAALGSEVVAYDNMTRPSSRSGYRETLKSLSRFKSFRFVKGDLRNERLLEKTIADADLVLHTAGQVAVTWSMDSPTHDFEVNARGTLNVLEAARKSRRDPRLIFTSTNKVYGGNVETTRIRKTKFRYVKTGKARLGVSELTSVDRTHHSPYGTSKLAADLYVQDYSQSYGLKSTVFRMSCIYGDRQSGLEDQGWVAWFALSTLRGRPIRIFGDGRQVRDVLYVDDLVRAFHSAALGRAAAGEVFNIGGGPKNTLSLLELLDALHKLTGRRSKVTFHPWRPGDQKVYISDIRKAKERLRWSPAISPEKGLRMMLANLPA